MKYISHKLFAVLLALITLAPIQAQTRYVSLQSDGQAGDKTQWVGLTVYHVKPEARTAFEEFVKREMVTGYIKGGGQLRDAWVVDTGDTADYYFFRTLNNLAEFDPPSPVEKGLGAKAYPIYLQKLRGFVRSTNSYLLRTRPQLSYTDAKPLGVPKLGFLQLVQLADRRGSEYVGFERDEMLPVVRKSGVPGRWQAVTVMGGNWNLYWVLRPISSWADFEQQGNVADMAVGQEEAQKLNAKLPPGVTLSTERLMLRYLPELSIANGKVVAEKK